MRRNAKVDINQPEIVEALRSMGAFVLHTHQLKNAFDILVGYKGKLFIMEIKDGKLPPSKKRLSNGELECKEGFESVEVPYHIVESVEEAVGVLKNSTPACI